MPSLPATGYALAMGAGLISTRMLDVRSSLIPPHCSILMLATLALLLFRPLRWIGGLRLACRQVDYKLKVRVIAGSELQKHEEERICDLFSG